MSTRTIEGKLKILVTHQKKFEEIVHIYLIFCVFGDFHCVVVYRKRPCLVGVYENTESWNLYCLGLTTSQCTLVSTHSYKIPDLVWFQNPESKF